MKKIKEESGQSTVEFALTLSLLIGFSLFFLQLSLIFSVGNYFHYATFMTARALLSAGPDKADQLERARVLGTEMVKQSVGVAGADRWPGIAKGIGGGQPTGMEIGEGRQFSGGDPAHSWEEGVRYNFRSPLFLGFLGGATTSGQGMELTSESWLGREPSYQECQEEMSSRAPGAIIDNGC